MIKLTRREFDCIYWVGAGKSTKQIASILNISTHTVNYYLASVSRKYKVTNRQAAFFFAYKAHLGYPTKH